MKRKPIVVGIGEVLWDLLPNTRRLGGAPANFAYHAGQQGAAACAVSAIGRDSDGEAIIAEFRQRGLDTDYLLKVNDAPTGTVCVELSNGIPSYQIHAPVAWDFIPWSESQEALAQKADAVCFGSLAQRGGVSRETIRRFLACTPPACLKVFDVNLRQNFHSPELIESSLAQCNMLKVSDEELPVLAEIFALGGDDDAVASKLIKRCKLRALVLTRGGNGATFYDGKTVVRVPATDLGPQVDTVGCGDAFTATLTAGLLQGLSSEAAMTHASRIAGLVCASSGAMPGIPAELKLSIP